MLKRNDFLKHDILYTLDRVRKYRYKIQWYKDEIKKALAKVKELRLEMEGKK
jgi:hypothetical protein